MHIVEMIGCIVSESPWAMVMEYVPFGDLHSNLVYWKKQVSLFTVTIIGLFHFFLINDNLLIDTNSNCIFTTCTYGLPIST